MKFHIDPPKFEPAKTPFNGSKLVWLTDGENFFERVENIHIKQVLEYDTLSFNYGLHNATCKSGSSYASCFMKVLLDLCCQWTIYRISMDNGDAWNSLDTMNNTDLILAVTHHSVRYDNQKLIHCFGSVIKPYAIYDAYLSHKYSKCRDDLGCLPATARYVDNANYIWHEIYKEEKEAFDNNRLNEILPLPFYEKLEEYTIELLNYIRYKYFGNEPEYERAPKPKQQALPQPTIPEELDKPEVKGMLDKARDAGWLDDSYQPKLSRTKTAMLANQIGTLCDIHPRWRPFEILWHREHLCKDYDKAQNQKASGEIERNMKHYLQEANMS